MTSIHRPHIRPQEAYTVAVQITFLPLVVVALVVALVAGVVVWAMRGKRDE